MASTTETEAVSPALQSWLSIAGVIAAPITAISALCYYFGYVSTRKRMSYLGIDPEAVGFSANDYIMQSAGVLYVIALSSAVVFAAVLAVCTVYRRFASAGKHGVALRRTGVVVIAAGLLAILRGVAGVWRPETFPDEHGWLTPLALAVGAALMLLGGWMLRTLQAPSEPFFRLTRGDWTLLALTTTVLVLGVFWTTNAFATKAGEVEGINAVADLWSKQSTVILDTPNRLFLPPNLVRETQLPGSDARTGPTYRYECFRAIAVRGDRWVLLPANWRPEFGYALLVTEDSEHRITLRSIKGAPERMGNGANVRDYWPCPELVKTAQGDAVPAQLLSLDEVSQLTDLSHLKVEKEYIQRPRIDSTPDAPSCASAINSTAQEPETTSGFVQRYGRELVDTLSGNRVDESVVEFATAHQASEYHDRMTESWRSCTHTEIELSDRVSTQTMKFGDVRQDGNVQILAIERGTDTAECSHASSVVSNVVSDVVVCAPGASDRASAVVEGIRDRFPR